MPERRQGETVVVEQSWHCTVCGIDRSTSYLSNVDSLTVKQKVLGEHKLLRPECPADDLGPIRFRDQRKGNEGAD